MNNVYNRNKEKLYMVHFPGSGLAHYQRFVSSFVSELFKMSDKISMISIMNKECYDSSVITTQANASNISLCNTALDEKEWCNTIKISHILKNLEDITTEYVVITDGRDVIVSSDLDNGFIDLFESYNKPIIYNATPIPYPRCIIEDFQSLIKIRGTHKYLNAGLCIGKRNALIEFYTYALDMVSKMANPYNSEQYIIRHAQKKYPELVGVDNELKLFRICHPYDSKITDAQEGRTIII